MNSLAKKGILLGLTLPLLISLSVIILSSPVEARGSYLDSTDNSFRINNFCYVQVTSIPQLITTDQSNEYVLTEICSNTGEDIDLLLVDNVNYKINVNVTDPKARLRQGHYVSVGVVNVEHPTDSTKDCDSSEELEKPNSGCWKHENPSGLLNGHNPSNQLRYGEPGDGNGCICTNNDCSEMACFSKEPITKQVILSSGQSESKIAAKISSKRYCSSWIDCYLGGISQRAIDYYGYRETCSQNSCTIAGGYSGSNCQTSTDCDLSLNCVQNICSGNTPRPGGEGCAQNSDCQSNSCRNNVCEEINTRQSCTNNDDCPDGQTCDENKICKKAQGTSGSRCDSNNPCEYEPCENNICTAPPTAGKPCQYDTECDFRRDKSLVCNAPLGSSLNRLREGSTLGICVTPSKEGERCETWRDCERDTSKGMYCHPNTEVCTEYAERAPLYFGYATDLQSCANDDRHVFSKSFDSQILHRDKKCPDFGGNNVGSKKYCDIYRTFSGHVARCLSANEFYDENRNCPEGLERRRGSCIQECGEGQNRRPNSNQCYCFRDNEILTNGECVCEEGYDMDSSDDNACKEIQCGRNLQCHHNLRCSPFEGCICPPIYHCEGNSIIKTHRYTRDNINCIKHVSTEVAGTCESPNVCQDYDIEQLTPHLCGLVCGRDTVPHPGTNYDCGADGIWKKRL